MPWVSNGVSPSLAWAYSRQASQLAREKRNATPGCGVTPLQPGIDLLEQAVNAADTRSALLVPLGDAAGARHMAMVPPGQFVGAVPDGTQSASVNLDRVDLAMLASQT